MMKTLKVLMMLGCFPMMLSAKEYKNFRDVLSA